MEGSKQELRIYFCGSIRGGRQDAKLYNDLIGFMKNFGNVLTEHIGRPDLVDEREIPPSQVHERDLTWLRSADLVIAEVSTPSLGVGYELGRALEIGKPILCLFRKQEGKSLSAMISGSPGIRTVEYGTVDDAKRWIEEWMERLRDLETKGPRDRETEDQRLF